MINMGTKKNQRTLSVMWLITVISTTVKTSIIRVSSVIWGIPVIIT